MSNRYRYQHDAAAWLRTLADEVEAKRDLSAYSIIVNFHAKNGALTDSRGYHKPRTKEHNHG